MNQKLQLLQNALNSDPNALYIVGTAILELEYQLDASPERLRDAYGEHLFEVIKPYLVKKR